MKIENIDVLHGWAATVKLNNDEVLVLLHALKYYTTESEKVWNNPEYQKLKERPEWAGVFELAAKETEAARKLHNEFLPAFGPDREYLAL